MKSKQNNQPDDCIKENSQAAYDPSGIQPDLSACISLYEKALSLSSANPDQTIALLEECLQDLQAIHETSDQKLKLLADCALQLAFRYDRQNQMDQAIRLYEQSLETMQKLPEYNSNLTVLDQAAGCFTNLAWIYLRKEEGKASIENIEQALKIYEKIASFSDTTKAYAQLTMGGYFNAAVIFNYFGRQQQASFYLQKSIERQKILAEKYGALDIFENLAHSYALQARIYSTLHDYQKAFASRLEVIEIFKDLVEEKGLTKDRPELANAYDLGARAAFQALDDKQAIELFLKRIAIHKEDYQRDESKENRLLLARDYQSLAGLYQTLNQSENYEKAAACAKKLLEKPQKEG